MEFFSISHNITEKDILTFHYPNQRLAVIAHIENEKGEILLQQRGPSSRDENGLYEDIAGGVEEYDASYKAALQREITEEVGNKVKLDIRNTLGLYHSCKGGINWLFIVYFVKYIEGKFEIIEKEKCQGYQFFTYDDLLSSPYVTESCKALTKGIKEQS